MMQGLVLEWKELSMKLLLMSREVNVVVAEIKMVNKHGDFTSYFQICKEI